MKWTRLIPGISLILAGLFTSSMKVVTDIRIEASSAEDAIIYSPLVSVIGGLLIIAGGFMVYNEIIWAQHEETEVERELLAIFHTQVTLKKLYDADVISKDEYDEKKRKILEKI
jgi:hypothetical protein